MMYIGADPVMTAVVVAGIFIYYAFKGSGKKHNDVPLNKMSDGRDFSEWYMDLCEKNRKNNENRLEEIRYQKWLLEHRQD